MANIDTSTGCLKRVNQDCCSARRVAFSSIVSVSKSHEVSMERYFNVQVRLVSGFGGRRGSCICTGQGVWPKLLQESSIVVEWGVVVESAAEQQEVHADS